MSVTLGIYKVKDSKICEAVDDIPDIPVSFERVWLQVWVRAIKECDVRLFVEFRYFSVSQIPEVLEELDRIYEWVQMNGGEDTDYICGRIRDSLKPFLIRFYQEHKDENYCMILG
jgi:hypothetical protein